MNIEALLPDTGALIWRDQPGVRADVQRLVEMWGALLQEHGGPCCSASSPWPTPTLPRVHAPAHVRFARSTPHRRLRTARARDCPA